MGRPWRCAGLGALFILSWSCADGGPVDEEEVGSSAGEIFGGKPRDDHPEIGRLWLKDPDTGKLEFCTATLVDRKIAVTAGHCMNFQSEHRTGDYGFLEIFKKHWNADSRIYEMQVHRFQVTGYHNFTVGRRIPGYSTSDVGVVRLAEKVPCSLARPARLAKNPPPRGTVVSRWGFGQCYENESSRKRVKHFRRGQRTALICSGDSGGPTMDPNGGVFTINVGRKAPFPGDCGCDTVAPVGPLMSRISEVMDKLGRGGRCD
jgi:hypothetical protein